MKNFKAFLKEEDGFGVVEVILILTIMISVLAIFRTKLITLVNNVFSSINSQVGRLY